MSKTIFKYISLCVLFTISFSIFSSCEENPVENHSLKVNNLYEEPVFVCHWTSLQRIQVSSLEDYLTDNAMYIIGTNETISCGFYRTDLDSENYLRDRLHVLVLKKSIIEEYGIERIKEEKIYDKYLILGVKDLEACDYTLKLSEDN